MSKKVTIDKAKWDELRERLGHLAKRHVKVGVFQDAGYAEDGDTTLAEVAAYHEYGAPKANIPERSFIRRTFTTRKNDVERVTYNLARGVVAEKLDVDTALERLGAWGAAQVKATIRSNIPPPLKSATVKRKGSSTALVDTGQLINSITWKVES